VGAKLFRADIRTETDGRTDIANNPFCNFAKAPKSVSKNYFSNKLFVHYIKYGPNYDYGPYCKPFLLKWVLQKSKEKQFVFILNARTVIKKIL
jgi:hypothetical protein